jgi:hypothetical protein
MKPKTIRYAAFLLLIGLAVTFVLFIKIGLRNQKLINQLEEKMSADGDLSANPGSMTNTTKSLSNTNQISN